MYKKKIAVRAMTAIAAGALLASNVMVAGATGASVTPTEKVEEETTSEPKEEETDEEETADTSETSKEEAEAGETEEELPQEGESKADEDSSEKESEADETQDEAGAGDAAETEEEPTEEVEETEADGETEESTEAETAAPEENVKVADEAVSADTVTETEDEAELTEQIAHVQFTYNGEVVDGGDYFVMADKDGVFDYEELKQYVPDGYTFTVTGEASVHTPTIVVELTKLEAELTEQIAHVQFTYNGEFVAGGDYFVMADKDGVFDYEELKQYVPEGYTFTITGDASVHTPQIVVELTKLEEELTSQIAHVQFVYNGEVLAGGDYFVMADKDGVFDYEELKQYVPEGYTFTITGDESVHTPQIVVELTKLEEELTSQIAHVQFVYNGEVLAGGDYFVMADKDGVFKYEELKQYVPEGYTFTITGDESVHTPQIVVELTKIAERTAVKVSFVDENGQEVQAAVSIGLWNPEDQAEYEAAVKAYLGDSFNAYDVDFGKVVKGEDGQYNATVVLKKAAERTAVKVSFVDENGQEVQAAVSIGLWNPEDQAEYEAAVKEYLGESFDAYDVDFGKVVKSENGQYDATVVLKKKSETPDVATATSTITIEFKYGEDVKATQTITKEGKKTDTFTVSSADVNASLIPSGYGVASYFETATYHFGDNGTLTVTLKRIGGGSSSGGGSGSGGGGSSVSSTASGVSGLLTSGEWKWLDDIQKWEYNYTNGTKAKNGWFTLEWQDRLDWYYFDADGYLMSGWCTDANGAKYYLHSLHDGRFGYMYTGWNKVDGQWQHFNDNTEEGVYGALDEGMPVPAELANL